MSSPLVKHKEEIPLILTDHRENLNRVFRRYFRPYAEWVLNEDLATTEPPVSLRVVGLTETGFLLTNLEDEKKGGIPALGFLTFAQHDALADRIVWEDPS